MASVPPTRTAQDWVAGGLFGSTVREGRAVRVAPEQVAAAGTWAEPAGASLRRPLGVIPLGLEEVGLLSTISNSPCCLHPVFTPERASK